MAMKQQTDNKGLQNWQMLERGKSEHRKLETKVHLLESQLTIQNSVFKQLFEKSADANMLVADGMLLRCNQAAVAMFGCENEHQLVTTPVETLSPERQPDGQLSIEKGNDMMMEAMEQGNHRFDWLCRRTTGEEFWVEVLFVPLEINGLQMLHVTCRDISDRKRSEVEIFKQQQQLRSTYDGVEHCIVIINVLANGDFCYAGWNPATAKITGVDSRDVIGKTPEKVFGETHGAQIRHNYEQCLAMERSITYEESLPFNGCDHWWITTLNPLKDEHGKIYRIVLTTFDITERKTIEATLQQKEAQYRSIFEAVNDGLYINDLTTGKTIRVNPATAELYGYTVEEFMQLAPTDFVHPNSLDTFARYIDTIRAGERFTCEAVNIHKDGSPIEIEVTGVPCLYNGEIHGLAIIRDIGERKAFERQQARLLAILEATSDLVGIFDMQGRQQYINAAGRRMLKIPIDENIVGMPLAPLLPDWARPIILEEGIPTAIKEGIWQGEAGMVSRMGQEIPISQVIIAHQSPDGVPEYLSTIIRDITTQKQTEDTLQKNAQQLEATLQELQQTQFHMIQSEKMSSLGQLVAGVAHEINNPVSFIYGNLEPLEEYTQDLLHLVSLYQQHFPKPTPTIQTAIEDIDLDFLKTDLPRMMGSISMGAERIREIVTSLRTFSRLDEAACKAVDIHKGIDSSLIILEHRLKATSSRPAIQITKQYGNLPMVECYAGQLNQVIMNILVNALDALDGRDQMRTPEAMHQTPSAIIITTQLIDPDRIAICIADNGPGIPGAIQTRIFDPFFTTKPTGKGTGLGMSLSYQIITENHGGTIRCVSSSTTGTGFIIEIPCFQGLT